MTEPKNVVTYIICNVLTGKFWTGTGWSKYREKATKFGFRKFAEMGARGLNDGKGDEGRAGITWTQHPLTGSWWSEGDRFLTEREPDDHCRSGFKNRGHWILYDYHRLRPGRHRVWTGSLKELRQRAEAIITGEQHAKSIEDAETEARWRAQGNDQREATDGTTMEGTGE